jgi:hypothetical protein
MRISARLNRISRLLVWIVSIALFALSPASAAAANSPSAVASPTASVHPQSPTHAELRSLIGSGGLAKLR